MFPGLLGAHLSAGFASSDTIPYAIVAATVSLGIAICAGLLALSLKGRTGLPRLTKHTAPPFPDPALGRPKHQVSVRDMLTAHLVATNRSDQSRGERDPEGGAPGADQAPASSGPSSESPDPLDDMSGRSTGTTSSGVLAPFANGSAETEPPQDDAPDGSA
jgi:hypothetical protein